MLRSEVEKHVENGRIVFNAKMEYQDMTDAQLRLVITTVKAMLLERQQERATEKHLKKAKKSDHT